VFDRKFIGAQFVRAFISIGTRLRHVEAQGDGVARRLVEVGASRAGEDGRQRKAGAEGNARLDERTAIQLEF
jgi:hypothetical protein